MNNFIEFCAFKNYDRGLAHSGEGGVYDILKLLNDELVLGIKLSGCATIADIDGSIVRSPLSF
jgi:isopentenyl diphosphate isomerase/L-lactate dehydrogenase-like FMN-dependent dehydrogenase